MRRRRRCWPVVDAGRRRTPRRRRAVARCVTCCPRCTTPSPPAPCRPVMPMRWLGWSRISTSVAAAISKSWSRRSSIRPRPHRSKRSAVRCASSVRSCRATTGCAVTSICAGSVACVAGSTGSPGCATPTLVLDPLTDAAVANALGAAITAEQANGADDRTLDQVKADALVGLITGARSPGRGAPEVSVLIDFDTLRDGLHDRSVCETSTGETVPVATVRRLCCDADIVPVVLDGDGVALDVGRAKRVATREQRRALRAMYRTCAHPGCTVGFDDCDIHHVNPWTSNGVYRPRQPAAAVQPPPPPRPRRRLDAHPACRPHHRVVSPRRQHPLRRLDRRRRPRPASPPTATSSPAPTTSELELLNDLSQTPAEIAELAHLARARVRSPRPTEPSTRRLTGRSDWAARRRTASRIARRRRPQEHWPTWRSSDPGPSVALPAAGAFFALRRRLLQDVHAARRAEADDMGHADGGPLDLTVSRLAA